MDDELLYIRRAERREHPRQYLHVSGTGEKVMTQQLGLMFIPDAHEWSIALPEEKRAT